jgi:colicin import membrane protein
VQAVEASAPVYRMQAPVQAEPVMMVPARNGSWGAKRLGLVAVVIAGVVVAGAAVKGFLPDGEDARKAEQEIARLEAVSKSMLKLVENDRQEVKEATTIAGQEVERLRAQVSTARAGVERQNLEAALLEALQTARLNASLDQGLRSFAESPEGLPRIEGSLAAAAVADRAKDRTGALKQLGEAVAGLTQMRAKIADERKTLQAELIRRREAFQVAQGQARAQDDARATADARARTESLERAKAASDARSRAANEGIAKARAEASARAEAETRARNEADARASADSDARAKAASEARARAEAAATARADAAERAAAAAAARQEAAAARQEAAAAARAKADSDRQNAEAVFGIIRSFAR